MILREVTDESDGLVFDNACVMTLYIKPGSPWGNGYIESREPCRCRPRLLHALEHHETYAGDAVTCMQPAIHKRRLEALEKKMNG